jgi:hypothetical protein
MVQVNRDVCGSSEGWLSAVVAGSVCATTSSSNNSSETNTTRLKREIRTETCTDGRENREALTFHRLWGVGSGEFLVRHEHFVVLLLLLREERNRNRQRGSDPARRINCRPNPDSSDRRGSPCRRERRAAEIGAG